MADPVDPAAYLTMDRKKKNLFTYTLIAIGLLPLLHWMYGHLNQDAWWDELISLKDYALVGFGTTVTAYPEPGNHILFNLFDNLISRIIGVRDFYEMLDHIWKLRLAQGIFALGTCIYTLLTVRRFFGEKYAALAVVFLASCIPFLNFSLQLRGYNMSMFFVAMVIYHCWTFLETRKPSSLILTGIASFLLLYTVPSNVYFLFGLALVTLLDWWRNYRADGKVAEDASSKKEKRKKTKSPGLFSYPHIYVLTAIGIGTVACFGAYQPVMDALTDNRFVSKSPGDRYAVLNSVFPKVVAALFSNRWLLLVPVLGSIFFRIIKMKTGPERGKLGSVLILFLLPFVFLFIHDKAPFQRTFVHLAPVFAILLAGSTAIFLDALNIKESYKKMIVSVLALYCMGNYFYENREVNAHLDKNLQRNKREQNIYHAFFLADNFRPHHAVKEFLTLNDTNAAILLLDELDRVSYLYYLEKYDLVSYAMIKVQPRNVEAQGRTFSHVGMYQRSNGKGEKVSFQQIPANLSEKNRKYNSYMLLVNIVEQMERGRDLYLFTGFPRKAEKAMDMFFEGRYRAVRLNDEGFANLYRLERVGGN